MKKRKIIVIITTIIILITIPVVITKQNKPREKEEKANIEIMKEKYQVEEETIYYEATMKNKGKKDKEIKSIEITFKDEEGKKIVTVINEVNKKLKPKETAEITSQTKVDLKGKQIKKIDYKIN